MKAMIQRVRGTRDFGPQEMMKRRALEKILRDIAFRYGFSEVQTPVMETSELFVAKSGPGILQEMYTFRDKGGRELALRPELTAPVIRFFVNELSNLPLPLKFFSIGSVYRYEEPQLGRYREFFHFDVEIIGSSTPEADAELLIMADEVCRKLSIKKVHYRIGHIGIVRHMLEMAGIEGGNQAEFLRLVDKKKMEEAADWLKGKGVKVMEADKIISLCSLRGKSRVLENVEDVGGEHLRRVAALLEQSGINNFDIDLGVVRGLDYYIGTVFEIDAPELGAEKQICGGGGYSLSHLFGGQEVQCTGFAFGFDRLMLAMDRIGEAKEVDTIDVFVACTDSRFRGDMFAIAASLRAGGFRTDVDIMGRSLSKALKYASSRNAGFTAIVGEREVESNRVLIREMKTGKQMHVEREKLGEAIRTMSGATRA